MEDTFLLGKHLPIVAMNQLPKLASAFSSLQECSQYKPKTNLMMCEHINEFVRENQRLLNDERELKGVFETACKRGHYGSKFLSLFERKE